MLASVDLPAPLEPGARLGSYTIVRTLGEGGMGIVYEAEEEHAARPVALKVLSPWLFTEVGRQRFEREIETCAHLEHPNTVVIYDHGETEDGTLYYAMELLDGLDLRALVELDGPQSPPRTIRILDQIAGALGEAHQRGLVHRDIKPPNIVLCELDGVPDVAKLVDFGLVTAPPWVGNISVDGPVLGTPRYVAPEMLSDAGAVTAATDLYALGLVAFFLLTGRHAFDGPGSAEILEKQRVEPAPSLLDWGAPADLAGLVSRCLDKDPTRRPADALEFRQALARCEDASRWDADAARRWWAAWRAARTSAPSVAE
jgi:serine/threonine protein kinase